jgi:hypothetical protein
VEPEFPYQKSLLDVVPIHDRVPPAYYPPIVSTRSSDVMPAITGAIGAGVGLAVGVGLAKRRNNKKAAEEKADSESGEA